MAGLTVAERMRLASLVAGRGFGSLRSGASMPLRMLADWRARGPERLLIAPQDIRTADPTAANDIYAGYFALGGKVVNTHGRSPFQMPGPTPEWEAALAGFSWLRHLRAADTPLARANGQALVDEWMTFFGTPSVHPAWTAPVAARRLLSWLSQSPLVLEGADNAFYRRFMRSLGRHAAFLQALMNGGLHGDARLVSAIALAELALCAEGLTKLQRRAFKWLGEELTRQVLPDGGHISRNPQMTIDLLLDLLPLRQAFAARAIAPPPALLNSIDRMMPMLRLFRHGDGNLALFNGMGVTTPDAVATVLTYDDARTQPLTNAPHSGYQRVEADTALLLVDSGRVPPVDFSGRAHAGTLSFEFSYGVQRIIINCGAPQPSRLQLRDAARMTAAHSTLVVADTSSARFAAMQGVDRWLPGEIVAGAQTVAVAREPREGFTWLQCSHDGYARRFGLIHHRRLGLSSDGIVLDGEDVLEGSGSEGLDYALRFHLHPSVAADVTEEGRAIMLNCADGTVWAFTTSGPLAAIEESIFFAGPDGPRPTQQIVVSANAQAMPGIAWRLQRIS